MLGGPLHASPPQCLTMIAARALMAASMILDGSTLPAASYVELQLYMAHCLLICGVCLQCGEQVPIWDKNWKLPKNRLFLHRPAMHSSQREMETGLWICPLRELGPS